VLIALLADIHANRQAFAACLEDAAARGAGKFVLLGDYVGYGADPAWTVAKAMELVAEGAIAVLGNHDYAISGANAGLNSGAQTVVDWTRGELGVEERRFLASLPLTVARDEKLFVHADASAPKRFIYVETAEDAARSLNATKARVTFCGHVHRPAIYSITAASKMTAFTPVTDVPIPLQGMRRWLAVLGSVGQPRDGNPAASYCTLDTDKDEVAFRRVPYDVEQAAAAIKRAGMPQIFAGRLFVGR